MKYEGQETSATNVFLILSITHFSINVQSGNYILPIMFPRRNLCFLSGINLDLMHTCRFLAGNPLFGHIHGAFILVHSMAKNLLFMLVIYTDQNVLFKNR